MEVSEGRMASVHASGDLLPPRPQDGIEDRDVRNFVFEYRLYDSKGNEVVDQDFFIKRTIEKEALDRITEI